MKRFVEHLFTGSTTSYGVSGAGYMASRTNLGELIIQNTGASPTDKWAGPLPIAVGRPMEAASPIPVFYPWACQFSSTVDWVFLVENSTAASATRRIVLYEYNRSTGVLTWKGFSNIILTNATAHTIRGFRMSRDLYTTGTVSSLAANVTLTGTGTSWSANRMNIGSRIAFGTTDPTLVPASAWNEIMSFTSDTVLTLTSAPVNALSNTGVLSGGTSYVIEDLRAYILTTNATLNNGGLFMVKGLRYERFTPAGTTIPAATTTDRIRGTFFLSGANINIGSSSAACGMGFLNRNDWQTDYCYVIDNATTPRVFKFNTRAALTSLAGGASKDAFVLHTNTQTVTGALAQTNNGRWGWVNHGPHAGVSGLYFSTASRIWFAADSGITLSANPWITSSMVEIPPGGATTFAAGGAFGSVEISNSIDRLILMSTGAAGIRSYITKYNTNSDPLDHIFLNDDKQLDQSTADTGVTPHPSIQASIFSVWAERGILYLARHQTTAAQNQIYAIPIGTHWTYAGNPDFQQRLITPEISTPNCSVYSRLYINSDSQVGTDSEIGVQPETFRVYYRTGGISDNSGAWTLLDDYKDISGVGAANSIQFMFEFKVIGQNCIPNRIYGLGVVYEDTTTDSHYQPSVGLSSLTGKRFAWRFSQAFGTTVPTLYIRLYDASTNALLLGDNTVSSTAGTWYKTTDATTWGAYNTTDKANETTYISYIPTSFADNIRVQALLTQS